MEKRRISVGLLTLVIAVAVGGGVLSTGCSVIQPVTEWRSTQKSYVAISGFAPEWDLNEMVRRSDAVVIGTLTEDLGIKTRSGVAGGGESPKYNDQFRDYKLTLETVFYPSSGLPANLAVLTGPKRVAVSTTTQVVDHNEKKPEFELNERVLLFLQSLDQVVYEEGPGSTTPAGFAKSGYYRTITSRDYGKLVEAEIDGSWMDTRSFKTITEKQVREAVTVKASAEP